MSKLYDYLFKVLLFGDDGVGKRTLSQNFLSNPFRLDSKKSVIGVDFAFKFLEINEEIAKLQIWLFRGEERFRSLFPTYARGSEGAFFLYDVTNYSSLEHLNEWLTIIEKDIKEEDQFPIIVVGNKADLVDKRKVTREEGIQFAKSRGVDGFIEISAKTGENVEEMFIALTKLMIDYQNKMAIGKERINKDDQIKELRKEIETKDEKIANLKDSLKSKEKFIRSKNNQIKIIENSVKIKEKELEALRKELKLKNEDINKLKDSLKIKENFEN